MGANGRAALRRPVGKGNTEEIVATGITSVDMTTLQGTMQQGDKFAEFYLDKTNVYETVLNVYYHEVGSEK